MVRRSLIADISSPIDVDLTAAILGESPDTAGVATIWNVPLTTNLPPPYHKGLSARPNQIPMRERRFVAWDGEGMNLKGAGKPQSYVLFGASTGDVITGEGLKTFDLCDFIITVGRANPDAIHVGFAFTYDANMIVQSLHPRNLAYLHTQGHVTVGRYCIQLRRGKWFSVTQYGPKYSRTGNTNDKFTVKIYDIFGFFTCSFLKAVTELLGPEEPGLELVKEGKALRGTFTDIGYVEKYWRAEIELLARLAEELRRRMYAAGLYITQWHGPGALASYAMKQHGIKTHMQRNCDEIREASRYAYAGGRFELFKAGRVAGPVYSLDINSAYPYAISQLPSLAEGEWTYEVRPTRIARFGVYRVRLRHHAGFAKGAGPLFHRDWKHNISYPWIVEGWYWSPEVAPLVGNPDVEILEGWHYIGAETRPFHWIAGMYEKRRQWKAAGNTAQLALKLCMNSLYGKMAQRVGWDERNNRIPPWHQLEWAGWVTSYTRAMLFGVMRRIPWDQLIAVETDGIYTTCNPTSLGISNSAELGGWEFSQYDEVIYLQSGLAWLRKGDEWSPKRRGLDAGSFSLEDSIAYAKSLQPNQEWSPYIGETTRFIGLGAALAGQAPVKVRHCVWQTTTRAIMPGEKGKRIHVANLCNACRNAKSAYDAPHDLVIRSLSQSGTMSTPHNIPWENKDDGEAEWRDYAELQA
jgi:hypothetical protein